MGTVLGFLSTSSFATIVVIVWLSLYFIGSFWVFIYRWFVLRKIQSREDYSLEMLLGEQIKSPKSAVFAAVKNQESLSKEMLDVWKMQVVKSASSGLVFLSVVSSTAPFVGLFGTVVEILEAFSKLGINASATFDIIAPIISRALVATACGVLTAIPAYSFYVILKRKLFELSISLQSQVDVTLSNRELQANVLDVSSSEWRL